jgi:hypothetical protein
MKRFIAALGLVMGVAAIPAQAEILDFNIGDNAFRLGLAGPLARLFDGVNGQYDVGVLLKPKTEDNLIQVHTGILLTGDAGSKDVDLAAGLGARLIYTGRDHDSGGAFAPGGQLEARLPGFNRLGLTGYAYYAPEVICFGEVGEYFEYGVDLDYAVIKGGSVYVGYRKIEEELSSASDFEVENSAHIGFRLKF